MGDCQARHRGIPSTRVWVLAAVVCALVLAFAGVLSARMAYSASEPNNVDYEFTDAATNIIYKVTTPADAQSGTAGEVELADGSTCTQASLSIGMVSNSGLSYKVTAVRYSAFAGNASLQSVVFTQDLTAESDAKSGELAYKRRAIGTGAFKDCTALAKVSFECSRLNGIGDEAFFGCTSLESVTFKEGLEIFGERTGAFGIGENAFANAPLTSIKIPVITCAKRTGDYYQEYDHDYAKYPEERDASGYQGCWHAKMSYFGIEQRGICAGAFRGTKLTKIIFAAGNDRGLFAYWSSDGAGLRYLTSLESVVYEAAQPYYGNSNASMRNGQIADVWGLTDNDEEGTQVAQPTFYYAVDFYTTKDQADNADSYGTSRIARVEYARNTPVSAIQSADADALAGHVYAQTSDYATKAADGTTPDPNAAARAAQAAGIEGFEDASSSSWVWMLDSTQSRRAGLSDSCKAYLVKAGDLQTGRIDTSDQSVDRMGVMQLLCDQNMSQGSTQNSPFDYARYYAGDSTYVFQEASIKMYIDTGKSKLTEGMTPWFELNSRGKSGLLSQMRFYDGAGNQIDASDGSKFSVSFKTYNADTGELADTALEDISEGPVLLVLTALDGSGYTAGSTLEEWMLVKGSAATFKTLYTGAAHDTWRKAVYINGTGRTNPISFDIQSGFAIAISSGDVAGALSAVGYAGMCQGPINCVSSDSSYGFGIAWAGAFYNTGDIHGDITSLGRDKNESDANLAASNYLAFKKNRDRWGVSQDYQWGKTAVLVNPANIGSVAAAAASYAYANAAPVFYTDKDGSLGSKTAKCLADFEQVLVIGDSNMVSDAAMSAAQKALASGGTATRLSGAAVGDTGTQEHGNACSLSLAMAQLLISGDEPSNSIGNVAIVVANSSDAAVDAASVMNFTGKRKGITLQVSSVADAKRVAQFLRDNRDSVSTVRVFGRSSSSVSSGFDFEGILGMTWDEKAAAIDAVKAGDTLELYGTLFAIGKGNALSAASGSNHLWGLAKVPAGSYPYGTDASGQSVSYTLARAYDVPLQVVKQPKAASKLIYNASKQIGVAAAEGLKVKNGSGKDAGAYTAVVTPKSGYCWEDGSNRSVRISWQIAPASLVGAKVTLANTRVHYTGDKVRCGVSKVTLANGRILDSGDYSVSYANNRQLGMATVKVTGTGNVTGTITTGFAIIPAPKGSSSNDSGSGGSSSDTRDNDNGGNSHSGSGAKDGDDEDGKTTVISSDDPDGGAGTDRGDGWTYFEPKVDASTQDTSLLGSVSTPPAVNIAMLVICCLAFAAAIFYATHARKETDDALPGETVDA